jgi:hypothetical protein
MTPPWTASDMVSYGQKMFFFNFCYLIRVEHKKCSEMCVWIFRFGQKLRIWEHFERKIGNILRIFNTFHFSFNF